MEAVLKNVPAWRPNNDDGVVKDESRDWLTINGFDIKKLLHEGPFLVSSEGKEFEVDKPNNDKAMQRQKLNQQFGFDKLGLKSEQFIDDDDLCDDGDEGQVLANNKKSDILADEINSVKDSGNISAREINRLKRKARMDAKAHRKADEEAENEPKKIKLDPSIVKEGEQTEADLSTDLENSPVWPLSSFYDQLLSDLLSARWERRHGAAMALRHLVRLHGASAAGHQADLDLWLEDLCVRLVGVLALDRFGDFVGDSVVCPVRESVGQVVGVVLDSDTRLTRSMATSIPGIVSSMMSDTGEWHTRHAAMIIVKYVLACVGRGSADTAVLQLVMASVLQALQDDNDDVVSVAATALLPVTHLLASSESLETVTSILWEHTLTMDDITSSTQSIMCLLSQLLSHNVTGTTDLVSLVPRLYPFMSHNSSQVRKATLSCLHTLSSHDAVSGQWLASCCQDILSYLYTRALLEHNTTNLELVETVWSSVCHNTPLQPLLMASCPLFSHWLQLISSPPTAALPLDHGQSKVPQYLGGPEAQPLTDPDLKSAAVWRARNTAAKMLGVLSAFIVEPLPDIVYTDLMETPLQMFLSKVLIPQLNTSSAYHKLGVSMLILHWLDRSPAPPQLGVSPLPSVLLSALSQQQVFSEISSLMSKLSSEAVDYVSSLKHFKLDIEAVLPTSDLVYNVETVQQLLGPVTDHLLAQVKLKTKTLETIQQRRQGVMDTLAMTAEEQNNLELLTMSSVAAAVAFIGQEALPDKLNPVIKPVMETLKRQPSQDIQKTAARALARILQACISRETSPNDKVIKNLCAFVCSNPELTPVISMAHLQGKVHQTDSILTLHYNERKADKANSSKSRKNKRTAALKSLAASAPLQATANIDDEEEVRRVEIQRRGATLAVQEFAEYFGHSLPDSLPKLWECCYTNILQSETALQSDPQSVVNSLSLLSVISHSLSPILHPQLLQLLPTILNLCQHSLTAVRYMAAVAMSQLAKLLIVEVMTAVVEQLLPGLEQVNTELRVRQGVVETLHCLAEELELAMVPYIVLLVVPVMGAMSDNDSQVRLLATNTFASLVRLMPLEGGVPEPDDLSPQLKMRKEREKEFLSQLLDSKTAASHSINVPVNTELRSYQVAGVNWLAFLNKYRLHGILCDDMGLGKTLQSICMLASDHRTLSERGHNVQSLVVCPTTLGGHWLEEVTKFVSRQHLNPFLYSGNPTVRAGLKGQMCHHNLIITSYEIVRSDVEFLASIRWNYIILDEGHVIKNTKTKTAQAIRQLQASHRLILTGTPIQNSVSELWALFDFLMPGIECLL